MSFTRLSPPPPPSPWQPKSCIIYIIHMHTHTHTHTPTHIHTAQVLELLTEADKDGTGAVEWEEFLGLWQKVKHLQKVAEMRALFNEFDTDGGGSVDTKEVRAILTTIGLHPGKGELAAMIAKADADETVRACGGGGRSAAAVQCSAV